MVYTGNRYIQDTGEIRSTTMSTTYTTTIIHPAHRSYYTHSSAYKSRGSHTPLSTANHSEPTMNRSCLVNSLTPYLP